MVHTPIDLTKATAAFTGSASKAQTNYALEVPKANQYDASISPAAQQKYTTAMNDPQVLARRVAGTKKKSSNQKWIDQSTKLGAPRLNTGIAAAGPAWNGGFAPVAQAIDSFAFQPKGSDVGANYDNNAKALGIKLHNDAVARKAQG